MRTETMTSGMSGWRWIPAALLLGSVGADGAWGGVAPYPPSPVIKGVVWAPSSSILRLAPGSDNWPLTWAADDYVYGTAGDGKGFGGSRASCWLARLSGSPPRLEGENVALLDDNGGGGGGRKGSGLLSVNGTLYLWLRNANLSGKESMLGWSTDQGRTWRYANWRFAEFGYCTFLNYGKDYAGARDQYVYVYTPDTPSAYTAADHFILMRVPKDRITDRAAFEFFAGMQGSEPRWTREIAGRKPVFNHAKRSLRSGITYNAGLRRYLWWHQIPEGSTRFEGGFGVYDAPEPWGPWTTVYFTEDWDVGPGEHGSFCSKWMSGDGREAYLSFSGDDYLSIRKVTFSVGDTVPKPTVAPVLKTPSNGATAQNLEVVLSWNTVAGASFYDCDVATDATFGTKVASQSGLTEPEMRVSGLTPGRSYTWRVRAGNAGGTGPWSASWQFTTRSDVTLPAAPVLRSPAQGATGIATTTELAWNAVTGATGYRYEISGSSEFTTLVDSGDVSGTRVEVGPLDPVTTYHWRVAATGAGGRGPWSEVFRFQTGDEGGEPGELDWGCTLTKPKSSVVRVKSVGLRVEGRFTGTGLKPGNSARVQVGITLEDPSTGVDDAVFVDATQVGAITQDGEVTFRVKGLKPAQALASGARFWIVVRGTPSDFGSETTGIRAFEFRRK